MGIGRYNAQGRDGEKRRASENTPFTPWKLAFERADIPSIRIFPIPVRSAS
jgi:hypothetical protein